MALEEYRAGNMERSKEILERKSPKDKGDYNLLGWIFLRPGNIQKAEESFRKALDIPDSYCGLGHVFYQSGDRARALRYFEEGIKREPSNRNCLDGIALLTKGSIIKRQERIKFFAIGDYFWIKEEDKEPGLSS